MTNRVTIESDFDAMQSHRNSILTGVCFYYLTTLLAVAGVWFGVEILRTEKLTAQSEQAFLNAFFCADGGAYLEIAEQGYFHKPGGRSNVVFFSGYPLLGRAVNQFSGLTAKISLLVVSHVCLVASFVVFAVYLDPRRTDSSSEAPSYALLAFGLWPTTCFFRMAYTESLFLSVVLLAMYAIKRQWPVGWIALLAGALTAIRSVGVSLVPVVALYLWCRIGKHEFVAEQSKLGVVQATGTRSTMRDVGRFVMHAAWVLPLSCWGLIAYMVYQQIAFGNAFAFFTMQEHWGLRPAVPLSERLWALLRLEPIWSVYVPSEKAYWMNFEDHRNALYSLQFANPIFFMIAIALVVLGARKRWLGRYEILLSAGLLFIPYATHSYQTVMTGQARYASVVFPVYIVMGQLLGRCPPAICALLFAFSGFMFGTYSALFAAGYKMI